MARCNVCAQPLGAPVYGSPRNTSVTSNTEILSIPTRVYFCETCGHLLTPQLDNLDSYYDTQYNILIDSDEADQIYQSADGQKAFRADFQLDTLLQKLIIPPNARILDFGSGKGTTLRRLALQHPDVEWSLFEVSEAYVPFWQKFAAPHQWATYTLPEKWNAALDLVISFYVLEHVADLHASLQGITRALKDGGILYFVVPNVYANIGDFVVVDHVNHFSEESLRYLLESSDLSVMEIDATTHDSAFIVTARKAPSAAHNASPTPERINQVRQISAYWQGIAERVAAFEAQHPDEPTAIYGAGFYGTFIATCLNDLSSVQCFIDQNPFKQTQTMLDKPIVAPEALSPDIRTIYVGLNPRKAPAIIRAISAWAERDHTYFFL